MDTDSFAVRVKTEDLYEGIANDVEKRFVTSNYKVDRPLLTGKNKKMTGLLKDDLAGKVVTEFVALRAKTYAYLTDYGEKEKRAKGIKKCLRKRRINFHDYRDCLLKNKTMLRSQQIFKSEGHEVFTQKVKKKALINNDHKRLKTYNGITTYPYGTNAGKVCKTELLKYLKYK